VLVQQQKYYLQVLVLSCVRMMMIEAKWRTWELSYKGLPATCNFMSLILPPAASVFLLACSSSAANSFSAPGRRFMNRWSDARAFRGSWREICKGFSYGSGSQIRSMLYEASQAAQWGRCRPRVTKTRAASARDVNSGELQNPGARSPHCFLLQRSSREHWANLQPLGFPRTIDLLHT
jgi:hypothetical protein